MHRCPLWDFVVGKWEGRGGEGRGVEGKFQDMIEQRFTLIGVAQRGQANCSFLNMYSKPTRRVLFYKKKK